jgi:hypothetical protein
MEWVLEPDAKPNKWKVVRVCLESRAGDSLEADGCWTGQVWRVIGVGNKVRVRDYCVTKWAYKAEGSGKG